ncbi:MAG: transaldolase family protein [Christensenella sp.]|uniref:transaldolase family protein n=1 Tax=Christensenella sp. TaxID=1935934 RepID=UPI002B218E3F|nr:transaldolase family protein [Christensenella sp.]MEA5004528.1 transaldolase family protein [Christensenella sp.]
MLVLIDNANIDEIRKLYDSFPYDGVTTNPSILLKEHQNIFHVLKEIRSFIPKESMLHAQLISDTAEKMVDEAHFMLRELGDDLFVKVPVTPEGLRAIRLLKKEGINITATVVYNAMQAFMAAKAGARFAAPYINRLDNMGADGIQVAKDIHDIFRIHNLEAQVIAASFRNSHQVLSLCKYGVGAITAAPDVLRALTYHDATMCADENFGQDFLSLVNEVEGTHLK